MNFWVRATCAGGLILGQLVLGACSQKAKPSKAIQFHLHAEPVTLDPAKAEDGLSLKILSNLMQGLVAPDARGVPQAALAKSWKVSSDGKRYEFELRPSAYWSDNQPVTAEEFVNGIRRALDPKTGAKLADLLYPIRGARSYHTGKGAMEDVAVRAESPQRLIIELERPASYFLNVLALGIAMPFRKDQLTQSTGSAEARWNIKAPVTGPYKVGFHQLNELYLLEPNASFWEVRENLQSNFSPVAIRIVQDESTALTLFRSGKIDILTRVPGLELKKLKEENLISTDPLLATYYVAFHVKTGLARDREFRRAVAGSIQRDEIAKMLETGELPALSWIPPGLEGHEPYQDPRPRFAGSVAAYQSKKPAFEMGFDSSSRNSLIAEKIQQDLKSVLGAQVKLSSFEWKSYVSRLATDPLPLYRMGWLAPFFDPLSHLRAFTSKSPNNYTGWSHPRYDALVEKVAETAPGPARVALIQQASRILTEEEAVVIPIYHYVQTHAVHPRIKKFAVNPFGVVRLDRLEVVNP